MIPKIKKYLCRNYSIYKDGKLVVPAGTVFVTTAAWLILIVVFAYLSLSLILDVMKNPVEAVVELIIALLVIVILCGASLVLIHVIPKVGILNYIGKKMELTCDRVVFPESVTGIYTEIESLPDDDRNKFVIGLRPLMRKLDIEDKL